MATEDLLDINVYLAAVNALLRDAGHALQLRPDDLGDTDTVSKGGCECVLWAWGQGSGKGGSRQQTDSAPENLLLCANAAQFLRRLHADLSTLFGAIAH